MRKQLFTVLLSATLVGNLGCSHKAPDSGVTSSHTVETGQAAAPGQGSIEALGSAGQSPPRVSESLGATASSRPAPPAVGQSRKNESANYLVADNKVKSGPTYSRVPGAMRKNGYSQARYSGNDQVAAVDMKPAELYQVAMANPLSTFAADVDTASYTNVRRALSSGQRPSPDQVRVEEMINYFSYDLPEPAPGEPFSVTTELSECPWNTKAQLLRVAVKTPSIKPLDRPPCNLVFLLDVSGSMRAPDKLPLLKSSLKTLLDNLDDADRIAIVTYAGSSGLVLPSTPASDKETILEAIDSLRSGGSTNGASGIELAYRVAQESGSENSVNRVILCTDGDFNVGVSSPDALKTMIEQKRKSGLFLSVLGFGQGNNDKVMETLADNGNGNYASIDSLLEARKVLVEEAGSTLVTVAKDVKFQVAFNPLKVERYRILGYQNRMLAARDFDNDAKDAGDLGAGHAVTVLYEILPPEKAVTSPGAEFHKLKGGKPSADQLALVKLRYKAPSEDESALREVAVASDVVSMSGASSDQRWAVAVTQFGLRLQGDAGLKGQSLDEIMALAEGAVEGDDGYRLEFLKLVGAAKKLSSV